MSSKFLKSQWVRNMTRSLCMANPDLSEEEIREFVEEEYEKEFTDHNVMIHNSYENITFHTTLGGVLDWIQSFKPLIAESGVFFYPKHMKRNLNTEIIKECMLDARTIHKKEMFAALEAGDTFLASVKDIQQANDKVAANSGYGAEGQRSSFLFNMNSAMSVTSCGRGQLSTASQGVENLLADFVKFFNMDEFFCFINHIIDEKSEWNYDWKDIIDLVPDENTYVARFMGKFLHESFADEIIIRTLYRQLDDEMRVRTYYKANLLEFLHNFIPQKILCNIMETKCTFNKPGKNGKEKPNIFADPNDPPDSIREDLDLLTSLVMEFVNYRYGVFRYEDRMRYQKRYGIPVSDTDSIMICYQNQRDYIFKHILPKKLYRKGEEGARQREDRHFKVINTLSYITSAGIRETLDHYLGKVNVADEDKPRINMKNEFHYSRMLVTYAKKSYVGLQLRKESHIFTEPKLDVKGVNFFKSTASERTSKFIYDSILMNQILMPKSGSISSKQIYREIYDFQQSIADDIRRGDMGFLKRSIKVKSPDGYANPLSVGAYKAVWVWNSVCEDHEQIKLPNITTLVKVTLRNKRDLAKLEKWPVIYQRLFHLFETSPEVGDYIDEKTGKLKPGKGIKSIALPSEMEKVPDWILAIIDVETLVNDNMALFTQLMKPLGFSKGTTTHNGSTLSYYTNIVRI